LIISLLLTYIDLFILIINLVERISAL